MHLQGEKFLVCYGGQSRDQEVRTAYQKLGSVRYTTAHGRGDNRHIQAEAQARSESTGKPHKLDDPDPTSSTFHSPG